MIPGIDEALAGMGGGGLALALLAAFLLGLRHATDPDHVTALSTLVLSDRRTGARRASRLGFAWGTGHAVTLLALGLPVVLFHSAIPATVERAAEALVGVLIVALALRLLARWRRGYFHVHEHEHDGVVHAHPHMHEKAPEHADAAPHAHVAAHSHEHEEALGRTPLAAFGVGLVHGAGGSAGVGILLVGGAASGAAAAAALVLFAAATALSMASVSLLLGHALAARAASRMLERLAPALGTMALLFGAWYALGAI